jgi:arsenate reductase
MKAPDIESLHKNNIKKIRVLFLCTSNSARSQMAEAFLRTYAGDKYEAYSAGLEPKEIHPLTKKVMAETGIDISGQYPKALKDYMGRVHFGYLITVCDEAEDKCPSTFPGMGRRLHWSFEDPARFTGTEEEKLNKFREIRNQIRQKVQDWAVP